MPRLVTVEFLLFIKSYFTKKCSKFSPLESINAHMDHELSHIFKGLRVVVSGLGGVKDIFMGRSSDTFAKLRKATSSSVMSVLPSAGNNSTPTGQILMKLDTQASFRISVEKI
jgi:hypothetical protein